MLESSALRRLADWTPPYAVWLSAAAALFAWMSPNHVQPWAFFVSEYSMAVAAWVLGVWVLWLTRREPVALPLLALLALIAAVVPWVQWAAGLISFRGIAALSSLYLVGFALLMEIGRRAVDHWTSARVIESVAWVFLLGALLSLGLALYGWLQLDGLGSFYSGTVGAGRATANLNQPNQFATLLVMGIVSVAALLDTRRLGRVTATLLVILLAFGIAMTQSRAGLAEVAVVAALFVAKRKCLRGELRWTDVVVAALIVFAMPMLWSQILAQGGDAQGMRTGVETAVSSRNRLIHWQEMLSAIRLQPWFGWGWTNTTEAQYAVAVDFLATHEIIAQSHNLLIELVVWNGVPIGLILVVSLVAWFGLAVKRANDSSTLIMLAIIVAVSAHAMVEYPLHFTFFLFPVALLAGAVCGLTMPAAVRRMPVGVLAGAAGVLGIVLVVIVVDYSGQAKDIEVVRMRQARIAVDRPPPPPHEPLLLTQLHSFMEFFRKPPRPGMSEDELDRAGRVARRYPSGAIYVMWASALAMNDRPQEAQEVLRRVCKLDSACEMLKRRWRYLGEGNPSIAKVPWPQD